MTDHRNKFSFMGILLLLIGIALAVTGWIVTQGVTDGIQYIVSAPEDKDALKDAYREREQQGLKDYLVIDTEDALLICPREDKQFKDFISGLGMPEYEDFR